MSPLEKQAAEKAAKDRYLKLKRMVEQGRQREIEETRMKKEEVEKIDEVEREIEEKERELEDLRKEVRELEEEMMMEAVRMDSGGLDDEERGSVLNKQKGDEIKKVDLETIIDQKKEGIRQLKKKEDYEDERKVVEEYLERYRVEEVEKRRREDDDNDGNDRQQKNKKLSISQTLPNILELYRTYFFSFLNN